LPGWAESIGVAGSGSEESTTEELLERIATASPDRIFQIDALLRRGVDAAVVTARTGIDPWFLDQIARITECRADLAASGLAGMDRRSWRTRCTLRRCTGSVRCLAPPWRPRWRRRSSPQRRWRCASARAPGRRLPGRECDGDRCRPGASAGASWSRSRWRPRSARSPRRANRAARHGPPRSGSTSPPPERGRQLRCHRPG